MNKQKLIQAVEKASSQTRGQAAQVIDTLVGVRSIRFVKKEREKCLSPEPDSEREDEVENC